MAKMQTSLLGFVQATSNSPEESEDSVDENVDLQEYDSNGIILGQCELCVWGSVLWKW